MGVGRGGGGGGRYRPRFRAPSTPFLGPIDPVFAHPADPDNCATNFSTGLRKGLAEHSKRWNNITRSRTQAEQAQNKGQ